MIYLIIKIILTTESSNSVRFMKNANARSALNPNITSTTFSKSYVSHYITTELVFCFINSDTLKTIGVHAFDHAVHKSPVPSALRCKLMMMMMMLMVTIAL